MFWENRRVACVCSAGSLTEGADRPSPIHPRTHCIVLILPPPPPPAHLPALTTQITTPESSSDKKKRKRKKKNKGSPSADGAAASPASPAAAAAAASASMPPPEGSFRTPPKTGGKKAGGGGSSGKAAKPRSTPGATDSAKKTVTFAPKNMEKGERRRPALGDTLVVESPRFLFLYASPQRLSCCENMWRGDERWRSCRRELVLFVSRWGVSLPAVLLFPLVLDRMASCHQLWIFVQVPDHVFVCRG